MTSDCFCSSYACTNLRNTRTSIYKLKNLSHDEGFWWFCTDEKKCIFWRVINSIIPKRFCKNLIISEYCDSESKLSPHDSFLSPVLHIPSMTMPSFSNGTVSHPTVWTTQQWFQSQTLTSRKWSFNTNGPFVRAIWAATLDWTERINLSHNKHLNCAVLKET